MKIIVGVIGQIASGKGILVDYLTKNLGFRSFSLSSIVHKELKKWGIKDYTRKDLQDVGDELRKKYGRDILAKRAMEVISYELSVIRNNNLFETGGANRLGEEKRIAIEGIRNPAEIEHLKKIPSFVLIGVRAKRELRFRRLQQRAKPWDPTTWKDFLRVDKRDLGISQKADGQQVGKCLVYCDYILTNNKDLNDFYRKVEKLMKKIFLKLNS